MNCLSIFLLSCFLAAAVNAGEVLTDKPLYNPGDTTYIDGLTFGPGEIVTLQVTLHNGTPLRGEPALPWTVQTNTSGSFESNWLTPPENWGDTLLLTAAGSESADTASVSFISGNINLDQLQNGTTTSAPQWANGNINGTNSCYSEGSSVPYRYFLDGLNGGTTHFFTIQSEWTKGTIHALDYLANFNATEDSAITLAGGPCGTIATSPPTGCVTPTDSILFWDFTDSNNYTGTIPSDFFTIINPGFVLDGPRYLKAYNVTSISFDSMWFTGTASDRELNVKVRFTVDATGSVGFFWGGHLAEGTNDAWGFGMGSASVSGAPYHMRAVSFDGGGGSNQDRSIQNGVICLPPDAAIVCDGDTVCNDTSYKYVCRDTSTAANKWSWTLINGTIVGSSSLDSVKFQVSPGMTVGDTVWIIVTSCDTTGGCPGDFCCASDTAFRVIVDCNNPPVATCHADTAVFLCDLGSVCIPGFSCYDPDGNLVSCAVSPGTLSGDTVCFTPAGAGIYTITLIATDAFGEADTCTTNVTVTVNSPPVATCAPNDTLFVCNLDPICVKPFSCSDIDGNLVSCVASPGTLVGDSVCFTPVDGDNIVMLVATDACGDADTCYTTIHVDLNSPPVATCAPVDTLFVCDLSPLCIPGFSCYDADGNLTSCVPSLGTLSNDTVCFTPIEGDNNIMLVATDDCGEADTCYTTIRVELNTAPVCDLPNDTTIFQCSDEEICRPVGATDVDGNFSYCEVFSGSGSIVNGEWCFTPTGPGVYSTVIRCYDSCGAFCQGSFNVTVEENVKPELTCPSVIDTFLCAADSICYKVSVYDPDDGLTGVVSPIGVFNPVDTTVCFDADTAGTYVLTLIVSDTCGAKDTCTTTVDVTFNSPPVATCAPNDTLFVCDLSPICVPGFSSSDPDGNLTSCVATPGTLSGDSVCFTPVEGDNVIMLVCTDACGDADTCYTTIHVDLNTPPVATCAPNDTLFVCDLSPICVPGFSCYDADGNLTSCVASPGTLSGDTVCFTPVEGDNTIMLIATDACGEADTCYTTIRVELNTAPVCDLPNDTTIFQCADEEICRPVGATDVDGNFSYCEVFSGSGSIVNGEWCFTPTGPGVYSTVIRCYDSCGAFCQGSFNVTVEENVKPELTCPSVIDTFLCAADSICYKVSVYDPDDGLTGVVSPVGVFDPLDTTVCFYADTAGTYVLTLIVSDTCGAKDTCTTTVNVTLNSPPVATCALNDTLFVCDLSAVCVPGFSCSDPDGNLTSCVVSPGTLSGGSVCFTPVEGDNTIMLVATDACGAADTCYTIIHVDLNGPPVANAGADQNVFQCVPTQICWPAGCSDPDSNLDSCKLVSGPGTFDGSQICFTPAGSGSYQFVLKAKDACGLTDFDTAVITVTINTAPVANCAPNDTLFRCNLSTICVKGFSCTDIDGNLVSCVASPGTLVGDSVCFIPVAGNNTITLIATDACGKKDTCQTIIRVVLNSAPVASCPPADTVLLCDLDTTLCVFGWWCTDPDGTPAQSGEYCFTPVAGINNLMNVCVDSCGAADTCQTFVFVIVNGPPEVTCPSDTTIKICNEIPDSVCIPGFDATDPNGNLATVTINGIPFDPGDLFCFTPDSGLNVLILEAEDACGLTAVCTTIVNILDTCLECPTFVIEKTHGTLQGTHEQVDVSVIDGSVPWGGFDILIAFDRSALNFQNVIPGDPYDQCGWEYITFRTWFWPSYEPHFFWAGIIRVFGLADLNNGPNHPSCFILPTPFVLFTIDFLVTDNLLFECQYVPIRFFWTTCNDNAVSSVTGDTLFVSDEIWEFDLGGEISDGTVGFPTYQGIQDSCLHGGGPGKPAPIPCIDFYNGGIDIICVDSIDDRGDINLNGVPNEIADAVLFTNYFIYGLSVFQVNPPGQIVATDVNADGLTLTVGDLVYLIRIIVGDAIAYSKLEAVSATYAVQNGVISVGGEMGAALVVVEGNATPTLLARQMELKYAYDAEANVTRVLVYSLQGHGFSGEFLNTGGSVIGVEFGSINGAVVEATTLPITYALNQNYPNPFNPVTTISFTLPTAGSYALSIYNVAGQQVAEFTGRSEPGTVAVDWDASEMASGVYFYRLEAGSFAATRKMLLLK